MFEDLFAPLLLAIAGPIIWFMIGSIAFDEVSIGRYVCYGIGILCIMVGILLYMRESQMLEPDMRESQILEEEGRRDVIEWEVKPEQQMYNPYQQLEEQQRHEQRILDLQRQRQEHYMRYGW